MSPTAIQPIVPSTSTRKCRKTRTCRRWTTVPTSRSPTASMPGRKDPVPTGLESWNIRSPTSAARSSTSFTSSRVSLASARPVGPCQAEASLGRSLRQRQLLHARDGEKSRKNRIPKRLCSSALNFRGNFANFS